VHVKCRGVAGRQHMCRKTRKSCPTTGTGGPYGPTPAAHKGTIVVAADPRPLDSAAAG